jgi:hypothetical protein
MKKTLRFIIAALLLLIVTNCSDSSTSYDDDTDYSYSCGTYNGHTLYKGSQGGCYYINSNGNKTYVDRKYCNC